MKSSAVNLAANIFKSETGNSGIGKTAKEGGMFANFMERAGKVQSGNDVREDQTAPKLPEKTDIQQMKKTEEPVESRQPEETSQKNVTPEESEIRTDEDVPEQETQTEEAVAVLLGGMVQDVRALFTEKFQITEAEFDELMKSMDISAEDLLNPAVLTDMVKNISGAEDARALLVNETLYQDCRDIIRETALLQETLLEQVKVTPKELEQMLAKFWEKQNPAGEELIRQPAVTVQESLGNPEVQEVAVMQEEDVEMSNRMEKEIQKTDSAVTETDAEMQKTDSVFLTKTTEKESGKKENFQGTGNRPDSGMADFVNQLKSNLNTDVQTAGTEFFRTETDYEGIIRQISEQIHIHVTEEASGMEMQLHPEHLGKVELHLVMKQGTLNAQFSVENEQVKEAMESQIAQLREDFDKQGLKVEVVEVTVKTHEFEQNLMQGEESGNRPGEEHSKTQGRIRNGLEVLAEEADFLSEEELAEKMMKEDGTTLNYLA